ncbi:hypothetical protein [Deinococcus pimensis]|uniref:hypothetical protein n=1 Tax=Deinococcus pimensis TaxID=309888 RepID=UPI000488B7FE|nr:hypothetical protein [Deinococcus pimensis]
MRAPPLLAPLLRLAASVGLLVACVLFASDFVDRLLIREVASPRPDLPVMAVVDGVPDVFALARLGQLEKEGRTYSLLMTRAGSAASGGRPGLRGGRAPDFRLVLLVLAASAG